MVHAKAAKMKRKERKIFISNYLHFADFADSLRSLRGIRILIHQHYRKKNNPDICSNLTGGEVSRTDGFSRQR
jgi:hypothetical protein